MHQGNIQLAEVLGGGLKGYGHGCDFPIKRATAFNGKNKKLEHNIFDQIISLENLFLAWQEFSEGKMKKKDVLGFKASLENNIFQLHSELKSKTYQHSQYTAFNVCDPKLRRIHKAIVKDRILHHAIFRVLYPIFDKSFIFDSYSCRIEKGTHRAVNRLESFGRKLRRNNSGKIFALKCDIKKFFDSIDQNILLEIIELKEKNAQLQSRIISKEKLDQSLQSYLGVLKHCAGHKIEKMLMEPV